MTHKSQIDAINAELAKIGYKAVKIRRPSCNPSKKYAALIEGDRLEAWKPKNAYCHKIKARMRMWRNFPPFQGIKTFEVRNPMCFEGKWIDIKSPLSVVVQAVPRVPLVSKSVEPTPRRTFGRAGIIAYLRDKLTGDESTRWQLDPAIRYAIANQ